MDQQLIVIGNKREKQQAKGDDDNFIRDIDIYHKCLKMPEYKPIETKEKVIDEDEYLEYLEQIVTRDYYPGLKEDDKTLIANINTIPPSLNVDTYLINFASNELESVRDIISKDKAKKLKKRLWMYKEEVKSQIKREMLLDSDIDIKDNQYGEIKAKNPLFFIPSNKENNNIGLLGRKRNKDDDNSDGNESISDDEKKIATENTRLPDNFVEKMEEEHNAKVRKKYIEAYENSDVVKLIKEMKEDKQINGYSFVRDDKDSNSHKKSSNSKPNTMPLIFTWGELASTPIVIKESTKNQFKIPETPQRDAIAYDLVNKINLNNTDSRATQNNNRSKSHYDTFNQSSSLTPSGLKLLHSINRSNCFLNQSSTNKAHLTNNNSTIPTPQRRFSSIRIKKTIEDSI